MRANPTPPPPSDLDEATEPPRSGIDAVVDRWRGPLTGYLISRGLDAAAAAEVAEDVFVQAWLGERRGAFRGRSWDDDRAVGAWLRGIAKRLAAAARRARARASEMACAEAVPALAESPDEDHHELRAAIDRLPPKLREVVLVRYLDERTGAEAAAFLGISTKAIERRAARAREMLRALIPHREIDR